mmetsp:Transcript_37470/g.119535  ORF Transcript_37470/g.119535 Transcript_37470/m.119535 type:complete len:92 (-) Transcript_37470:79-354(-)
MEMGVPNSSASSFVSWTSEDSNSEEANVGRSTRMDVVHGEEDCAVLGDSTLEVDAIDHELSDRRSAEILALVARVGMQIDEFSSTLATGFG